MSDGLPADLYPVEFSRHATDRFVQRLRPGFDRRRAYRELCRMLASARVSFEPPAWISRSDAACWLLLGEDVCLPLHRRGDELIARTLVYRGSLNEERRERRNERRSARTAGRRAASKARHQQRPDRPAPSLEEWSL